MDASRIKNHTAIYVGDIGYINSQEALFTNIRSNVDAGLVSFRDYIERDDNLPDSVKTSKLATVNTLQSEINEYFDVYISGLFDAARANDTEAVREHVRLGLIVVTDAERHFDQLFSATNQTMNETPSELLRNTDRTIFVMVVTSLLTTLLVMGVALLMSRSVTKPVKDIAGVLHEVAEGNLNANTHFNLPKDELGYMTRDVYRVADTVRTIVDDIKRFVYETIVEGNLDNRLDSSKYKGVYRELVEEINRFEDSTNNDLIALLGVLDSINQGNFRAELEKQPGQKIIINEKVDQLMKNLVGVNTEINSMIVAAAVKGNLQFKIDDTKHQGDWKKIMTGLNGIASSVNKPIVEIRNAMNALEEGRFDVTVVGDYRGSFMEIKNAVNSTINGLAAYIQEIDECLGAVADGDLSRSMSQEMKFVGNFSKIRDSIDLIIATLNRTMTEITSVSDQVLIGARQITERAADLANGAQEQASSVEELNATMDMISQQTSRNAENSFEASDLSNKSASNAMEGHEAMTNMLEAMSKIKDSSNNISKIIKVIQDISFQTNLLSLNAAIEAARAGKHGKGFTVVAEEVRNLAARSQAAAAQTTELIEDSISRVESGSEIAGTTSDSLDIIVKNANDVLAIINSISEASQEQTEAIAQVSDGLIQISKVVQNNTASSEETAAASQELNSQAEMLRQLVSFFKL